MENLLTPVEEVEFIEQLISQFPQTEIEVHHYFGGGVYEREIIVPAGTVITGKIHLTEHLAKLVDGTMTIYSESEKGEYTGPKTFVSTPGVKRIGFAHTDVVFSTFHVVGEERDINMIETALVVDTIDQYRQIKQGIEQCHLSPPQQD